MSWYGRFPEYVSVDKRKAKIEKTKEKLGKKKGNLHPIVVQGRSLVAKNFWGKAWFDNLKSYEDCAYRLDRGRAYVRHGAVIDLKIQAGRVDALVVGTRTYTVTISIADVDKKLWQELIKACSGKINSLVELLQGTFSEHSMKILTQPGKGLFPKLEEITFDCSCPDYALMCKHVSAVLYGVGLRLDEAPEQLFVLRKVEQRDLLTNIVYNTQGLEGMGGRAYQIDGDLSALFGIEIATTQVTNKQKTSRTKKEEIVPEIMPKKPSRRPSKESLIKKKKSQKKHSQRRKI